VIRGIRDVGSGMGRSVKATKGAGLGGESSPSMMRPSVSDRGGEGDRLAKSCDVGREGADKGR
jgi:hypothetical protein